MMVFVLLGRDEICVVVYNWYLYCYVVVIFVLFGSYGTFVAM